MAVSVTAKATVMAPSRRLTVAAADLPLLLYPAWRFACVALARGEWRARALPIPPPASQLAAFSFLLHHCTSPPRERLPVLHASAAVLC